MKGQVGQCKAECPRYVVAEPQHVAEADAENQRDPVLCDLGCRVPGAAWKAVLILHDSFLHLRQGSVRGQILLARSDGRADLALC